MTSPKDPNDGDPQDNHPSEGDPKDGTPNKDASQDGSPHGPDTQDRTPTSKGEAGKPDGLNVAYMPPHARAYYANPDERIQNALSHVNPESAVTFLRKTHGPQAGQEALIRAFLAERQHHREAARYWLGVYEELVG